tara:strand:- start:1058 stop:1258 length:201 start_codon:yes stop_codon:yes gene_type:complete
MMMVRVHPVPPTFNALHTTRTCKKETYPVRLVHVKEHLLSLLEKSLALFFIKLNFYIRINYVLLFT